MAAKGPELLLIREVLPPFYTDSMGTPMVLKSASQGSDSSAAKADLATKGRMRNGNRVAAEAAPRDDRRFPDDVAADCADRAAAGQCSLFRLEEGLFRWMLDNCAATCVRWLEAARLAGPEADPGGDDPGRIRVRLDPDSFGQLEPVFFLPDPYLVQNMSGAKFRYARIRIHQSKRTGSELLCFYSYLLDNL